MANYIIKPLHVGTIVHYRGFFSNNQEQYKEKEKFPVLMFLIQGNGHNILMDTGPASPEEKIVPIPAIYRPENYSPVMRPETALKAAGVDPEDIDTVVISHLHWDHCNNNHLFPQADFYLQSKELINAVIPIRTRARSYETFSMGVVPGWARHNTKWKLIDGDYDLFEGIRLLHIPGHSDGSMGMLIDTEKGQYLLASDMVSIYENINEDGTINVGGTCRDEVAFLRSIDKMQATGATILPSHDMRVLAHSQYPY